MSSSTNGLEPPVDPPEIEVGDVVNDPDTPPDSDSYESPPEDGTVKLAVYEAVDSESKDLFAPPYSAVDKSLKDVLSGNVVIGESHEGSFGKQIVNFLANDGRHRRFFMEQISQDYLTDIDILLKNGTFSDALRELLRKHDMGHDTADKGFLKMLSSFAGKYKDGIRVTPIDRKGFLYQGGETGIDRVVGLNRDCEGFIRSAFEKGDQGLIDDIIHGRCVFFVGNSHAMRHQKDVGGEYTEPGVASRINSVLFRYGLSDVFFSNLIVKECNQDMESMGLAKVGLVQCDVTKKNEVTGLQDFAAENVLVSSESLIAKITAGNMSVPVLKFSDFKRLHEENRGAIDLLFLLDEKESSEFTTTFGDDILKLPTDESGFKVASGDFAIRSAPLGESPIGHDDEFSLGAASPSIIKKVRDRSSSPDEQETIARSPRFNLKKYRRVARTDPASGLASSSSDEEYSLKLPPEIRGVESPKIDGVVSGFLKSNPEEKSASAPPGTDIAGPKSTKDDQVKALDIFNKLLKQKSHER